MVVREFSVIVFTISFYSDFFMIMFTISTMSATLMVPSLFASVVHDCNHAAINLSYYPKRQTIIQKRLSKSDNYCKKQVVVATGAAQLLLPQDENSFSVIVFTISFYSDFFVIMFTISTMSAMLIVPSLFASAFFILNFSGVLPIR